MAFEPCRARPAQVMPADVRQNLIDHGITEAWIKATEQKIAADKDAEIDHDSAVDMAAEMIAVGPPLTFMERLAAWGKSISNFFKSVWSWFKGLFETPPAPVVTRQYVADEFKELISHSVVPYAKKKEAQGESGVKQEKVNKFLEKDWKKFVNKMMSGAADATEKTVRMSYLEAVVPELLKSALAGSMSGTVVLDPSRVLVTTLTADKITVSLKTT
jgi:hypothetical protein